MNTDETDGEKNKQTDSVLRFAETLLIVSEKPSFAERSHFDTKVKGNLVRRLFSLSVIIFNSQNDKIKDKKTVLQKTKKIKWDTDKIVDVLDEVTMKF